ncbi:PASTA domain-containing protein [Pseudonocardia sp.]|uniref:PASTA domain-containing protein n=1 Tax=Pseudonocardia sp. TaxID=60912 RepID=UPI003D0B87C5
MPNRAAALVVGLLVALGPAACGGSAAAPATTVTVTAPGAGDAPLPGPPPSTAPAVVAIPDLVGRNGAIARNTLQELGFAEVRLAADPRSGRSVVVLPENWTVTKVEPAPGTAVPTTQLVVVTMTK